MNRGELMKIVEFARGKGEIPDLEGADLRGSFLVEANLQDVNLQGANLAGANILNANLTDANLTGANLTDANLAHAKLWRANLQTANLQDTNLSCADLVDTDLSYANLKNADLWDTSLNYAKWNGLRIDCLPSNQLTLVPTPEGWDLRVNIWRGTPDQLRELMAKDGEWTEADMGGEITRCRPYLEAALALCDVHMNDHADYIDELKEKWGD